MSEQRIENALADLLESMAHGVDSAAAFGSREIPEAASELLTYGLVSGLVRLAVCLAVFGLLVWAYRSFRRAKRRALVPGRTDFSTGADWSLATMFFWLGAVIAGVIAGANLLDAASDVLKVTLAPRIYLLEYAASMVR